MIKTVFQQELSDYKGPNRPNQNLIPVAGVGTVGIVVTTPSRLIRIY